MNPVLFAFAKVVVEFLNWVANNPFHMLIALLVIGVVKVSLLWLVMRRVTGSWHLPKGDDSWYDEDGSHAAMEKRIKDMEREAKKWR